MSNINKAIGSVYHGTNGLTIFKAQAWLNSWVWDYSRTEFLNGN